MRTGSKALADENVIKKVSPKEKLLVSEREMSIFESKVLKQRVKVIRVVIKVRIETEKQVGNCQKNATITLMPKISV